MLPLSEIAVAYKKKLGLLQFKLTEEENWKNIIDLFTNIDGEKVFVMFCVLASLWLIWRMIQQHIDFRKKNKERERKIAEAEKKNLELTWKLDSLSDKKPDYPLRWEIRWVFQGIKELIELLNWNNREDEEKKNL